MKRNQKRIIQELLKIDRNFFTLAQIVKATGSSWDDVRDVLIELRLDGLLRNIYRAPMPYTRGKGPPVINVTYRIINPKKLAEKIASKFRGQNTVLDRLWFVIRKREIFTRKDLRILTGAKFETVRWYTKMLARAGIIGQRGRGEWILYKDTGPRRPYVMS
jgi:hypothetical protein